MAIEALETRLAIARQIVKEHPDWRICKGGDFLCPEAERLWRQVGAAYGTADYEPVREKYDQHDPHYWVILSHKTMPI